MTKACMTVYSLFFFLACLCGACPAHAATLHWQDNSSGTAQEDYFAIEKGPQQTGPFLPLATAPQNATSHVFTPGPMGSTEWFRVRGVNGAGPGGYCAPISYTVGGPPPPPPSNLVLALSMNAGTGNTVSDSSGQNNHGTRSGATWITGGKYGKALLFDGVNDWITIPDAPSLDLTTGLTMMAWVYPTSNTGVRDVLIKQGSNVDIYNLYARNNNGKPESNVYVNGLNRMAQGTALPLNTWTHLAGTYNGSALKLYVNGVQAASINVSGAIACSSGVLRIGGNSLWGEWFKGRIDEVRIFNRALTASEIVTKKNTPIP